MVFALTLPGLVVLLIAAAVIEHLLHARTPREADPERLYPKRRGAVTGAGLDVLAVTLDPASRHAVDQREHERVWRDEDEEGAPPRSRVDLAGGTAHLRLPRQVAG